MGQYFIAHRGESDLAPENTLSAFRLAWELDADAVELDIHLSRDNRIMVIHDGNTLRTSGQDHEIKSTDSDVLRNIDVGLFKDSIYHGEKIPFLEEVIETIPPDKELIIEIKSGADVLPALENVVHESDKNNQLVFIAFDWQVILDAKKLFPRNRCYWLSSNRNDVLSKLGTAAEEGLDGVNLHFLIIDPDLVARANRLNLEVLAWTVDDPVQAKRLIDLGVKALTTNRTKWLRSQLSGEP
jgi:glycerophosphoryl diester phosphodiesterase